MYNPTLTETDRAVLAELQSGPAGADALGAAAEMPRERIGDRLAFMADNGLVRVDDDRYELTDDGRRVVRAPGDGSADDSIDAPESVVWALQERGLRADRLDAVLAAFAFLRYWGRATAAELKDGTFSEAPLEFESAEAWWEEFVRDHLAAVPPVEPPATEGGFWRFTGTPGVDGGADGRRMLDAGGDGAPPASATEAIAEMGLAEDERLAVAAALAALQRGGEADDETLRAAASAGRSADGNAARPDPGWTEEALFDALARLPGVVRDGHRWRYALTPTGYETPE